MPFRILVVCTGNLCRSPLAEGLLRLRFSQLRGAEAHDVEVSSAGPLAEPGSRMDPHAAKELERLGGRADGFRSRDLRHAEVVDADLILTATRSIRSQVLQEFPQALRRTFTLTEFAALADGRLAADPRQLVADAARRRASALVDEYDVPDPIGQPPERHHSVAQAVDRATRVIAENISGALVRSTPATRAGSLVENG